MFGVLDLSFVYWIGFGVVTVPIAGAAAAWFKERQIPMRWWKWFLLALWYIAALAGIAAPFTVMGENEAGAGWRLLAFNLPIMIITGFLVWRILTLGTPKRAS